jgi:hypothetical protein
MRTGRRVDYVGAGLCVVGLGGIVFGLIEQPHYGWSSPVILAPLILGIASFAGFIVYERRANEPMLRARATVATAETETDNVWLQGWSNEDLAFVLKRAGRVDEAREALKRALAVWERKRCLPYVRRVREHIELLGRAQVQSCSSDIPAHWDMQVLCHLLASHSSGQVPKRSAPHHRRQ